MNDKTTTQETNNPTGASQKDKQPVYEKPKLRRHDQIDQVKPYGPSNV